MNRVVVGLCFALAAAPSGVATACDMPLIGPALSFAWPVDLPITEGWGFKFHPVIQMQLLHRGIDFDAPVGTPVHSAQQGRVSRTAFAGDYGNSITIDHGGGWETSYSHLQRFAVRVDDCIKTGDPIAFVGLTGLTQGPHLHFEILLGSVAVNPVKFLTKR
jgi:murein DD-endopeptidase MepM/ murein hydrolase activator NlpD